MSERASERASVRERQTDTQRVTDKLINVYLLSMELYGHDWSAP